MNLKKILSMTAAVGLTVSTLFTPVHSGINNKTITAAADNEQTYDSWQTAYRSVLEEFMYSDSYISYSDYGNVASAYDLYDIDNNGVPELFISEATFHTAFTAVYTFIDGSCIELLKLDNTDGILYYEESTIILFIVQAIGEKQVCLFFSLMVTS